MLSESLITYFSVTYKSILGAILTTPFFWEACIHFDVKSKQSKLVSSGWQHLKALLKLFIMVTDFSMLLSLSSAKKVKKSRQNFAQKLLSIFSALFKVNTFTVFALKSKRIELQRSAWRHLTAFLKIFQMVTIFPMVLFTLLMKCDKIGRTLVLNKIV